MIDAETWARMTANELKRALDDQHATHLQLPIALYGGWSHTNEELANQPALSPQPLGGWSGDLHELTWWFYKTPDWRWYFGRLKRDKSCWVFQVGRWGVHVRFKSE